MSAIEENIIKRKVVWKIKNFTRVNADRVVMSKLSEYFVIAIDSKNSKWKFNLRLRTGETNDKCSFYLQKLHGNVNFKAKMNLFIQKADNGIQFIGSDEKKASDFKSGNGCSCQEFIKIDEILAEEKFISADNAVTFIVDLEISKEDKKTEEGDVENMFTVLHAKHFNSKLFSDFTFISSDGAEIPVHRCIVSARSTVLDKMFCSEMVESKNKQVIFNDIDGVTMTEMMRYIYTGKVENVDTLTSSLIYAAEKYDLPVLKSMCVQSLVRQISQENVFESLILADQYNENYLSDKCVEFIKINYDQLRTNEKWEKIGHKLLMKIMSSITESIKHINIIPLCNQI